MDYLPRGKAIDPETIAKLPALEWHPMPMPEPFLEEGTYIVVYRDYGTEYIALAHNLCDWDPIGKPIWNGLYTHTSSITQKELGHHLIDLKVPFEIVAWAYADDLLRAVP